MPLEEGLCSSITRGQVSYKLYSENDSQIHEGCCCCFFKAADKRTIDKKEATTDKSFQFLVCGMQNGIK